MQSASDCSDEESVESDSRNKSYEKSYSEIRAKQTWDDFENYLFCNPHPDCGNERKELYHGLKTEFNKIVHHFQLYLMQNMFQYAPVGQEFTVMVEEKFEIITPKFFNIIYIIIDRTWKALDDENSEILQHFHKMDYGDQRVHHIYSIYGIFKEDADRVISRCNWNYLLFDLEKQSAPYLWWLLFVYTKRRQRLENPHHKADEMYSAEDSPKEATESEPKIPVSSTPTEQEPNSQPTEPLNAHVNSSCEQQDTSQSKSDDRVQMNSEESRSETDKSCEEVSDEEVTAKAVQAQPIQVNDAATNNPQQPSEQNPNTSVDSNETPEKVPPSPSQSKPTDPSKQLAPEVSELHPMPPTSLPLEEKALASEKEMDVIEEESNNTNANSSSGREPSVEKSSDKSSAPNTDAIAPSIDNNRANTSSPESGPETKASSESETKATANESSTGNGSETKASSDDCGEEITTTVSPNIVSATYFKPMG